MGSVAPFEKKTYLAYSPLSGRNASLFMTFKNFLSAADRTSQKDAVANKDIVH